MTNTNQKIIMNAKEIRKDRQTFIACSAHIRDRWYKIKFTRACEGAPTAPGSYELTVNINDMSLQAGEKYTKRDGTEGRGNDIIWVRKITTLRARDEEEKAADNRARMAAVFGDDAETDDLPF